MDIITSQGSMGKDYPYNPKNSFEKIGNNSDF